jgi:RNA recognition motif-containing protein
VSIVSWKARQRCASPEHPPVLPWTSSPWQVGPLRSSRVLTRDIEFSTQQPERVLFTSEPHTPATMSNLADSSRLKATVFVGGLDPAVTQQTLYHAFLPFGDIVEVNLPKPDLPSAKEEHRGFGYVEFETATDANDAIDNMDRSELYGQVIKVAAAKPQKDANEGLGSKTAVWEQVRGVQIISS